MATDQKSLYDGALRMVGERKLARLDEDRGPRYLLDDVWNEDAIKACLEAGEWAFATRTAAIENDNSVAPDFGFAFGFEKPTDWVRTAGISLDEYFHEPLTRFRDEAGFWWLDNDLVYVAWVSDDASYGRNYSLWPMSFVNYVESYLASKIIPSIANATTTVDQVERKMEKLLTQGKGKNAITRPTKQMPPGSWTSSRRGRWSDKYRRSDR